MEMDLFSERVTSAALLFAAGSATARPSTISPPDRCDVCAKAVVAVLAWMRLAR